MSRNPIKASLEAFARTGQIGPVALGTARREIVDALGPPRDWMNGAPAEQSPIWKYGDLEIYFEDDRAWLLHFDWFDIPQGGPTLQLDSWVVRRGVSRETLESAMRAAAIPFKVIPDPSNPGSVKIVTTGGVEFFVGVDDDSASEGLRVFGCSRT